MSMLDNHPALNDSSSLGLQAAGTQASLTPAAYYSLPFSLLEDAAIWTLDWVCIGTQADIPDAGDMLPFTVGDHAVHVQRETNGTLVGRFNLAQHGGCRTVPLQCQQGSKTPCSFTSCGHSLDRAPLRANEVGRETPEMYQYLGLRPERLLPVRTAAFGPLVFVNLNPLGDAFAATSRALAQAMPVLVDGSWTKAGDALLEFDGNWKLVGQILAASFGSDFTFTNGVASTHGQCSARGRRFAAPVTVLWAFPNLLVMAQVDSLCVAQLQPVALNRTRCRVSIFNTSGQQRSDFWLQVLEESVHEIREAQQSMEACSTPACSKKRSGSLALVDPILSAWLQDLVASKFDSLSEHHASMSSTITKNYIRIRSTQ